MSLELWDGVNLLGIGLEIVGFIFLLTPLKERFVLKQLTVEEKVKEIDVLKKESDWLTNKIGIWELMKFYREKMRESNVHESKIKNFMNKYADIEPTSQMWYQLSNEYTTLMASKTFGYVEWIAIGLVIVGLCCQGLSIFLEKVILV
jgi:ABC-type transport system involved in multi-copper enzyme maturation permease subunit